MRLLKLFTGIALCLCLSVVVYAHPGRTDSSGGHTNHSTGEYHYHHGYSEHQHYDQDGDGIADCPYEFTDKTDSTVNSYKSSKAESSSSSDSEALTSDPPNPPAKVKKTRSVGDYIVIGGLIFVALSFVKGCVQAVIEEIKRKNKK